jgi:hypothetical protein
VTEEDNKKPETKPKGRMNIKLSDDLAKGAYANTLAMHNNEAEFVLDFIFMEPQRKQGQVVSRVVTNPKTAKRLLLGMQEAVRVYEERFGEITLPQQPPPKNAYH